MKSLTCVSPGLAQNLHCGTTIFAERLPWTASALKQDCDIIIIKGTESLKLF